MLQKISYFWSTKTVSCSFFILCYYIFFPNKTNLCIAIDSIWKIWIFRWRFGSKCVFRVSNVSCHCRSNTKTLVLWRPWKNYIVLSTLSHNTLYWHLILNLPQKMLANIPWFKLLRNNNVKIENVNLRQFFLWHFVWTNIFIKVLVHFANNI